MPLQLQKGRQLVETGESRMAHVGVGGATREREEDQMKETAVYK